MRASGHDIPKCCYSLIYIDIQEARSAKPADILIPIWMHAHSMQFEGNVSNIVDMMIAIGLCL